MTPVSCPQPSRRARTARLLHRLRRARITFGPRFGDAFVDDVGLAFTGYRMKTILDVGANIGSSAIGYARYFPGAIIHAFEPSSKTFRVLEQSMASHDQVVCHHLALGAKNGEAQFQNAEGSTMASLQCGDLDTNPSSFLTTEKVQVRTVDEVCALHDICHVSFLKIDTEGHDLEVLRGAKRLLNESRIDFIQVEAGMNPNNKWHVSNIVFQKFLNLYDYFIFRIYEQVHEWPTKEKHLRRSDIVFVSKKIIEAYGKQKD